MKNLGFIIVIVVSGLAVMWGLDRLHEEAWYELAIVVTGGVFFVGSLYGLLAR